MSEYRASYGNSHALIVGINTYSDPRFVPLGQAEADATAMAGLLAEPPYNFQITQLLGAEATKSTILRSLHQLRRAKPDDRLLVYFAGHGYTLSDKRGSETGYLACADTIPDEDFTALKLEEVVDLTNYAEAKHIGFIFDACFSGQALGLTRAASVSADKYLQRRAYQVITAGAGDQTVSDYRSMTGTLIEVLRGDVLLRDNSMITMSELGLYVRDTIASDSLQTQIPQFGHIRGSQGGDFVFYVDTGVRLPAYLEDALNAPSANTRKGAVADLIELIHGETAELAKIGQERLAHIAKNDPNEMVRSQANSFFEGAGILDDANLHPHELWAYGTLETKLIKGGGEVASITMPKSNQRVRNALAAAVIAIILLSIILIWLIAPLFNKNIQDQENGNDNQTALIDSISQTIIAPDSTASELSGLPKGELIYGPKNGEFNHTDMGLGIETTNFRLEGTLRFPLEMVRSDVGSWIVGIRFRYIDPNQTDDWTYYTINLSPSTRNTLTLNFNYHYASGNLPRFSQLIPETKYSMPFRTNHALLLIVNDASGAVFLDNRFIASFPLSEYQGVGEIMFTLTWVYNPIEADEIVYEDLRVYNLDK